MMPFCGYNMADYFGHWIEMGAAAERVPAIYQVNWFRKGSDGRFLWPGFAENSRVIEWIIRRIDGSADAVDTPVGRVPAALNLEGIDIADADLAELFAIDPDSWLAEAELTEEFFQRFDGRVPGRLTDQLAALRDRLQTAKQG